MSVPLPSIANKNRNGPSGGLESSMMLLSLGIYILWKLYVTTKRMEDEINSVILFCILMRFKLFMF